jgi:hypothetical protein
MSKKEEILSLCKNKPEDVYEALIQQEKIIADLKKKICTNLCPIFKTNWSCGDKCQYLKDIIGE